MNEELKIIIKAVTDEAKKAIGEVKEELKEVEGVGQNTDKGMNKSMNNIAKGIGIAVAAVSALTAAMVGLGKKSQEVEKGFSKLYTTFREAGSTTQQATQTYKDLFSFLGDHDKAIEAAQSLALITTEEKELSEWSNILQGAYAKMGDKLPVEGLAEAANETINVGKATGVFADAINWLGVSEDAFNATLANTTSLQEREAITRNLLNSLYGGAASIYAATNQATIQYNQSQADLNTALSLTSRYTTPLLTSINQLGSTMLTSLGPAIRTVSLYLTGFIQLLAEAISWVGGFFGSFGSATSQTGADVAGYQAALKKYTNDLNAALQTTGGSINDNINKIKELKKQTMGFDELNVVSSPTDVSAGGGGGATGGGAIGNLPIAPNPEDYGMGSTGFGFDFEEFQKDLDIVKEKVKGFLVLVGLVGVGLLAWKIADFVDDLKTTDDYMKLISAKAKTIGGYMLIIAGALALVSGYTDAWANGLDWGNFAKVIGGIAAIVGGLALVFGALGAVIGVVIGAIAMIILGIKDFITNGYSLQSTLMTVLGVMILCFTTPVGWIGALVAAVVGLVTILWNEFEGFRNFWINIWNAIKDAFSKVVEWIKEKAAAIATFFKDAWQEIVDTYHMIIDPWIEIFKRLAKMADEEIIKPIKEKFADVWKKLKSGASDAWEGIKKVFSPIISWFSEKFSKAWEKVKNVFSTGGKIFNGIKEGIGNAFKAVVNVLIDGINKVITVPFKAINSALTRIKGISIVGVKPFDWITTFDIPQIPKLATGGILTGEGLFYGGEGGKKEAVLPLEQNTGWMDMLADRIAARNSGPSKIVLMVDGKELGWASINGINGITKQTGNLQLIMA